ncbi:MAG: patatin-like phospholipase family protein [Deltaproteobacteria bacterium]|nr:MAG: patatin-like phospholipase family protein [Deltaproteobacteria bacterium]
MSSPFASVVFAGGGSRCVWQIGFWEVVAPVIGLEPERIAAVSAGSAMASILVSGQREEALHHFSSRMEANEKNFYPGNLLRPGVPAFPQAAIYREAMLATFDDEGFRKLQEGPPIYILLARPPRWVGARSGALLGMLTYKLEKKLRHPLHPEWGLKVGFVPEVVSSHDCNTPEEFVDLVLQSSCTPPFTPLYRRGGRSVLDGGLVDNVPVVALPKESLEQKTLVLLSRPYPEGKLLGHPNRVYVQPSRPATVSTWDYTSPEGLMETYNIGREDGEQFLQRWDG